MRILLQFPEGLKQKALEHAKRLEGEGHEVIVSASPTYGACDLALDEMRSVKADKLVHFGHAEFMHVDANVEYVPYELEADLGILDRTIAPLSTFANIGLVTTIQHMSQLEQIKRFYEEHGKTVIIGKPHGFAKKPGQILGCDVGSASSIDRDVEAIVYFGGGMFHPLGALLQTTKPFLLIEPYQGTVEFLDRYRSIYSKKSRGKIMRALEAKSVGILLSTKNGQHNIALAQLLKKRIESRGMRAAILVANTFDFDSLNNMLEFDAFVNTACPRIGIDDIDRTNVPLLSANELMEVLKMKEELAKGSATRT